MKIFLNFVPKILHKYKFLFAFIPLLSAELNSSQNMDIDREITNFLKRHQIMVNPDQITPILFDIFTRTPNQNFAKGISIVDIGSGEGNLTLALLNTLKKFRNHGFCDIPININFFEIDQKKINKCNYNMGKESGFFPKLSWEQMGGIESDGWERFKNNTKEQKDSILFILSNPPYLINTPEKKDTLGWEDFGYLYSFIDKIAETTKLSETAYLLLSICDLSNRRRDNTELMRAIRGLSEALKNYKFKGLGLTFLSGNNLFEQKIKPSIMIYALTNSPAYTKENSNYKSTIPDLKAIYSIEEINEEWWKGNGILESTLATDNYLNLTNRFETVRFEDEYQTKTREKCGDSLPKNEDAKHYAMPSLSGRIRNYELDLDYYVRISATHKQQWLIAAKINFTTDKLNNYENPMTKIVKFVPIKLDGADGLVYQYLPSKYLLIGRKTDKKEKNVHKEKAFVHTYSAMDKEEALGLAVYLRHNTIHKKLTEHSTSVLFSYSNLNKLKVPTYGALMKHGKSIWGGMETITPNIFNGHYGQCSEDLMKRLCNDGSNNDVIQLFDNGYEDQIQIKQEEEEEEEEEEKQSIIQSNNNQGFVPYQRLGDFSKVSKIHKKPENKKIEKFNEKQRKMESKILGSVI